jgi:serine/threonine-protein kinase
VAPAAPTEPLTLEPTAGTGRVALLVLFVLLTVAAIVVGVFVVRGMTGAATSPGMPPRGAEPGSVGNHLAATARSPLVDAGGVR